MEQNDGMPGGYGRGRPIDITEPRRPIAYPTYTAPEFVPAEGAHINGMYPETSWHNSARDMSYMASPSGDHIRVMESPGSSERKSSNLSPYAKEFVPRSFRPPEPRVIANEVPDDSLTCRYPVQELRSFLNEITMNPGKFERKIQPLTETLNNMVDDDDTMRAIVNVIFDESIRQPNLRYSGARLSKSLCEDLDASPDRLNFRSVLLTRCNQEIKRREALAQAEDGGNYLRGFAFFMAELFSQLEVGNKRITVLGDTLPSLIKTFIQFPGADNLKCACQVLKLVGSFLEDYEKQKSANNGSAPEMDSIMFALKNLTSSAELTRNVQDLINSVIKLRDSNWGRSTQQYSENNSYEPPSQLDEPVMYGPDGQPMTQEELSFLQSQYAANSLPPEDDDYDLYNDDSEGMTDEMAEAYAEFIRETGQLRP